MPNPTPSPNHQKPSPVPREATKTDHIRARHTIGDFELTVCTDGTFLLDGGAMFGVVPKPLWSQRIQADEDNRILLGLNSLVVHHTPSNALIIIETGLGNKLTPKQRQIHQNQELLPQSLASASINPAHVTHVLNTHLHFDHCGWNTTLHPDGSVRPTFANARYLFAAGELAHGRLQLDRDRVSYLSPNYDPLIAAGQLTLLDPHALGSFTPDDPRLRNPAAPTLPPVPIQTSTEILPGLTVEPFPGHTASMLAIHIQSGGQHACYIGDLFPTHNHLDPAWVMGYDLDPLRCIEERKRFLARAIPERWLIIFPHDHEVPTAHLQRNEKGRPIATS